MSENLLIKEITFYQTIVDEKVSKLNDIIEIEKEFDKRLWEKAMEGFKRNYEKIVK